MNATQTGTPQGAPGAARRPSLRLLFLATRPAFLSITLVGCLIGLATAYRSGVALDGTTALLTILAALLAHAGANVVNDYHDALNGSDAANHDRVAPFTGGSRMIQDGRLSVATTARLGHLLLALVVPPGLWLAWTSGPGLLAIGLAGLVIGWAYSAPPLALMCRGLGEIAVAAGWLLVVVGTDYVQRGSFAALPLIAGLPFALLVADLLYVNQFPDRSADEAAGKRTLVVRLGFENARWGYLLIALVAYGWLVLQVGRDALPQRCALAAFPVVLSLRAGRTLLAHADQPQGLAPAIRLSIAAAHLHGVLLAATLALAGAAAR